MKEIRVKSKRLFKGRVISLRVDETLLGSRKVVREVVEHPGSVAIVPMLSEKEVILIKQYRYAVGHELLEIPAGTLERREKPVKCAERELLEETGYRAHSFRRLGSVYLAPGYCNELIHIYLAESLEYVGQRADEDERIRVVALSLEKALQEVLGRRFYDAKTLCGLFLAVNALASKETNK
ncbi:MAG: NUDIX hydrolase [Candidatus Bathyarchaeia archaeon]